MTLKVEPTANWPQIDRREHYNSL